MEQFSVLLFMEGKQQPSALRVTGSYDQVLEIAQDAFDHNKTNSTNGKISHIIIEQIAIIKTDKIENK